MLRTLPAPSRLLALVSLLLLGVACSSVGGVVTSSSTLHQARSAIHNGDYKAGMNLYRIVLEGSGEGSSDAAEARFHIALVRMSTLPELTDLGEARMMLTAIQESERDDYRKFEVVTLLGVLDRVTSLEHDVHGGSGLVAQLQGEVARLQDELVKKDETLKKVNAALGAR